MALRTDYKDQIVPEGGRKYKITANSDGTSSIEDVTQYVQEGDDLTAGDVNKITTNVNSLAVETGSNANGTYIKYPDGTLICTKTVSHSITGTRAWGSVFVEANGIINLGSWAMPFITRPVSSVTASCVGGTFWTAIVYPADAAGPGKINAVRATATDAKTLTIDAIGIGRWK